MLVVTRYGFYWLEIIFRFSNIDIISCIFKIIWFWLKAKFSMVITFIQQMDRNKTESATWNRAAKNKRDMAPYLFLEQQNVMVWRHVFETKIIHPPLTGDCFISIDKLHAGLPDVRIYSNLYSCFTLGLGTEFPWVRLICLRNLYIFKLHPKPD